MESVRIFSELHQHLGNLHDRAEAVQEEQVVTARPFRLCFPTFVDVGTHNFYFHGFRIGTSVFEQLQHLIFRSLQVNDVVAGASLEHLLESSDVNWDLSQTLYIQRVELLTLRSATP